MYIYQHTMCTDFRMLPDHSSRLGAGSATASRRSYRQSGLGPKKLRSSLSDSCHQASSILIAAGPRAARQADPSAIYYK